MTGRAARRPYDRARLARDAASLDAAARGLRDRRAELRSGADVVVMAGSDPEVTEGLERLERTQAELDLLRSEHYNIDRPEADD